MPWAAKFPGRCGLCDDPVLEGDECVYVDDEVCHADCASDEERDTDQ